MALAPPEEPAAASSGARSIEGAPPEAALVLLGRDLEVELRTLTASMGFLAEGSTQRSVTGYLNTLQASGMVSQELGEAIRDFWRVRNRIVHGKPAPDHTVLRAIDIGIGLLDAVRSIPHERNFVYNPGTDVFSDSQGTNRREGVLALVLRTVLTDGSETRRVYPTTRTDYVAGQRLAWEWNDGRQWGESWYRDPDTGEIAYAWTGSLEFVGRPLEQIE